MRYRDKGLRPNLCALASVSALVLIATVNALAAAGCGATREARVQGRSETLIVDELAISPDGRRAAFAAGRGPDNNRVNAIYVARRGCTAKRLTHTALAADEDEGWPAWSPDGSRIVFSRSGTFEYGTLVSELYVVNTDGSGLRQLTKGYGEDGPAWSPDGRTIASTRSMPAYFTTEIHFIDMGGSTVRSIIKRGAYPSWSRDGSKVAFVADLSDIALLNLRTKKVRTLFQGYFPSRPAWSPDGRQIVFSDSAPSFPRPGVIDSKEIYVVNADGTHRRRLTHNRVGDWNPTWPFKREIMFESQRGGGDDLYVMNLGSRRIRRMSGFPTRKIRVEPKIRCSGVASR